MDISSKTFLQSYLQNNIKGSQFNLSSKALSHAQALSVNIKVCLNLVLKAPYFTPFWDLIWGSGPPKMIYQWFNVEKTAVMCISMSSLLQLSWAPPLFGWQHFEWHATRPINGLILTHLTISGCKQSWKSCYVWIYKWIFIRINKV